MRRVFALLVGIDTYQAPVPRLFACKNDISLVMGYLEEMPGIDLHPMVLLDAAATKQQIVHGFTNHLSQAKEGDVALFYYSGHGTFEKADEVFWNTNPDRVLQSLLCYDGISVTADGEIYNLLADKEIRYLIHKVASAGSHFLTVFDCCHSGTASRSREEVRKRTFLKVGENGNLLKDGIPTRPWEDFIFASDISRSTVNDRGVRNALPEGPHIQIAACLPEESAYERGGNGVFTRSFFDVLTRTGGAITYFDLQSHVRNFIKNDFRQVPQFYVPQGYNDLIYRLFLDQPVTFDRQTESGELKMEGSFLKANVIFHPQKGWYFDLGHINGISKQAETVEVFSQDRSEQYLAKIGAIRSGETDVIFTSLERPDPEKKYWAIVRGFLSSPIKVFLNDHSPGLVGSKLIDQYSNLLGSNIYLAEEEYAADYTVQIGENSYSITRAEDPLRPLVPIFRFINEGNTQTLIAYLNHISQWEYVKNLHNPNSLLFASSPIQLNIQQRTGQRESMEVPISNGLAILQYDRRPDGRWGGAVQISVTNHWERKLFVACLYLSSNFQIYEQFLPQNVNSMSPGSTLFLNDGLDIPLVYEREIAEYNHKYSIFYLKIIASTAPFDVMNLVQDALPSASQPETRAGRKMKTRKEKNPNAEDWITQLYTVKIRNPDFRDS